MRVSLVGRLASLATLASLGALFVLWTSYVMCLHVVIDACVFGERLASLAAPASLGALLGLWTSYAMCLHVVIDACVFGGAPREPRCARLVWRPDFIVDLICYVSACCY